MSYETYYRNLNASWERALAAQPSRVDRLAAQVCAGHEAELIDGAPAPASAPAAECDGIPAGYVPLTWDELAPLYATPGGEAA